MPFQKVKTQKKELTAWESCKLLGLHHNRMVCDGASEVKTAIFRQRGQKSQQSRYKFRRR